VIQAGLLALKERQPAFAGSKEAFLSLRFQAKVFLVPFLRTLHIGNGATMQTQIVKMINDFEHGRLSRRQLIAYLTGMFAASLGATVAFADQQPGGAAPNPAESASTFDAIDLNHIALNATVKQRVLSRSWRTQFELGSSKL
jgi:hypothetical protein